MNMKWIIRRRLLYSLRALLVLGLLTGVCACGGALRREPSPERPTIKDADTRTLEEGLRAFESGDYEKARAIFEVISESAEDDGNSRKALFALAATRLILARTPEEFNSALLVWHCWSARLGGGLGGNEDPRMLTPLLERLTLPGGADVSDTKDRPTVKRIFVYGNHGACKDLLQAREREIERMRLRLEARDKEVKRLKHQIESLEAIHLKFQERKQGVFSP